MSIDEEPEIFPDSTEGDYETEIDEGSLLYQTVDDFMTQFLSQVVRRRLNRSVALWCPAWWRHPEAIARVTALWRSFEYMRTDASMGMSNWWLHHADPHLRALMDPDYGPFAVCDFREGHNEMELGPLPLEPSPPELWDHPAFNLKVALREEQAERERRATSTDTQPPPRPNQDSVKSKAMDERGIW